MQTQFEQSFSRVALVITVAFFLIAIGLIGIAWYLYIADIADIVVTATSQPAERSTAGETSEATPLPDADAITPQNAESDVNSVASQNEKILEELNDIDAEFEDSTLDEIDRAFGDLQV